MTKSTQLDKFFFIECIDPEDTNDTRAIALYEDAVLKMKIIDENIECQYFEIETKQDLLDTFDIIGEKEIKDTNVLIHISMHGSADRDGLLANDSKLITWEEVLDKARFINVKSKNGLFLILAVCHGSYIGEKISIKKKSPFNMILSSQYEESLMDIYNLFQNIYNKLVFDNNLVNAFVDAKTQDDKFYYKNTEATVNDAFRSLIGKREKLLPILYQEYIKSTGDQKISFEDFEKLNKSTFPQILKNMEIEFYIK